MRLRFATSSSSLSSPHGIHGAVRIAVLAAALVCALGASGSVLADDDSGNGTAEPTAAAASAVAPPNAGPHAAAATSAPRGASSAKSAAAEPTPVPPETSIVTKHALRLDGRRLEYDATAGNLLLRDDKGESDASMFYVAYTSKAEHGTPRPVTFLFNGGPGAASVFLLMGSIGPKRVHTSSPSATPPAPYVLADNPDSLLDKTDLVFIDAVGTGFSKVVGRGDGKQFWSVDGDLDAFVQFIDRYLTVNDRWNSPKFLFGESYGTARAAMLAYRLGQHEISLNGVVLLSSVLNSGMQAPGLDLMYVRYLPSFAATAWYHDKLGPSKPADLPAFLNEVRAFAAGPYAAALEKGDALPDAERDAIAKRIAQYTGLDTQYVLRARLRISPSHFRKQLLFGQARSVGRYDSRFEGIEYDDDTSSPDYDASERYVTSAFNAAFHRHLAQDLHDRNATDVPYRVFNGHVLATWGWKHRIWWGETLNVPYAAADLAEAMRQNPRLKVLSANGYFDLATPFFATEYDLAHMNLEPSLRKNLQVTYYPTGHMIYLDDSALHTLRGDLDRFYDDATRR
ncbi:S10 family peptidase [Trinickia dinghuensis]|uniref:Peptidase S10 n=1 Tax=Trinickia dinghuensis TaxID=2291023 RepID=A0A3D8K166_9BURK|nr:peptidase S10 [Trinickia dinghuensis]RDU98634.1 peptidase S10 [Trinickia dinghuensis]